MKTRTRSRRMNSHKRSKRSKKSKRSKRSKRSKKSKRSKRHKRSRRSMTKYGGGFLDYLMPEIQTAKKETVTNALLFGIYKSLEKENIKEYHQLKEDMQDFINIKY